MPLWKELTRTKSKATNMISMEADVYQQSPLAAKKEVSSVPTVLYVNEAGNIEEVEDARNKTLMKNIVETAAPPAVAMEAAPLAAVPVKAATPPAMPMKAATPPAMAMNIEEAPAPLNMSAMTRTSAPNIPSVIPGTEVAPNPLPIAAGTTMSAQEAAESMMPEQPIPQVGGNALASAIVQAAPVAILAGAYSMFGNRRSSGLPPARRTRRRRVRFTRRRRQTSRR
jgi:hypothetical protein